MCEHVRHRIKAVWDRYLSWSHAIYSNHGSRHKARTQSWQIAMLVGRLAALAPMALDWRPAIRIAPLAAMHTDDSQMPAMAPEATTLTDAMYFEHATFLGMHVGFQFLWGFLGSIALHGAFGVWRRFIVRPASRSVSLPLLIKYTCPLLVVYALSFYTLLSLRTVSRSNFLQTRENEVVYRIHQNCVEQILFTFLCCTCTATWLDETSVLPGDHLLFQMFLFLLGRLFFIVGYLQHPNKRIFGFNLGGFQLNIVLTSYVVLRSIGLADSIGLWSAIFLIYPPAAHLLVVRGLPRLLRSTGFLSSHGHASTET